MEIGILYCHGNVCLKQGNKSVSGHLCLVYKTGYQFVWIRDSEITPILQEIARASDQFDYWQGRPSAPTQVVVSASDTLFAPLVEISAVKVEPILTLHHDQEACIPLLSVSLAIGESVATWPDLWVEPGTPCTAQNVVELIRKWLRTIKHDLAPSSVDHVYSLTSSIQPDPVFDQRHWPSNLPQVPPGSFLYRLGSFGMDAIRGVVSQPIANKIEDTGWNVLDRFSRVTQVARDKTTQVLEHPWARPFLPLIPEDIRNVFINSTEAQALVAEYESSGHFLSRFGVQLRNQMERRRSDSPVVSKPPDVEFEYEVLQGQVKNMDPRYVSHRVEGNIKAEDWISRLDESGKLKGSLQSLKVEVFCKGVDEDLRAQVWKYILGSQKWESTDRERALERTRQDAEYGQLKSTWMTVVQDSDEDQEVPVHENRTVGDENEELDPVSKVKERKYRIEKDVVRTDPTIGYFTQTTQEVISPTSSQSDLSKQVKRNPRLSILMNVLMAYTVYQFELGYVQGMSDLCAPIVATVKDEVDAFYCFVGFMQKVSGMKDQLRQLELLIKMIDPPLHAHLEQTDSSNMFCCFRWLLIWYKREFVFYDSVILWQAIWTCPLTDSFHLFVALAILNKYRQRVFQATAFDEVLKCVNELSESMQVDDILQRAEVLFYCFYETYVSDAPTSMDGPSVFRKTTSIETVLSHLQSVEELVSVAPEPVIIPPSKKLNEDEWMELLPLLQRHE